MTKFESDVKYVSQPVDALYARYSDLRNLETLREKLEDPAVQEKMAARPSNRDGACAAKWD